MSSLTLQLDDAALREATVQAIVGTLTPEARQKLIENAVQNVLSERTGSYGLGQSRLQLAFNDAVDQVARQVARDMAANDATLRERMDALLRATADKVLACDRDKLAERMADAFVNSMRRD